MLVDLFLESQAEAPEEIWLDLDATDDPTHGQQEGRFYHGYYREHCYLPLYIFCEHHALCARLRTADRDASDGSVEELERIVVTNLELSEIQSPQRLYEQVYCARGEMENRIKEQQLCLFADRTSSATMRANQLRLYLSTFAYRADEHRAGGGPGRHGHGQGAMLHHPPQAVQDRRRDPHHHAQGVAVAFLRPPLPAPLCARAAQSAGPPHAPPLAC